MQEGRTAVWNRLSRIGLTAAGCLLLVCGSVPAAADPAVDPPAPPAGEQPAEAVAASVGPPPDTGVVATGPPGVAQLPDGRTLTVAAKDETQLPVAPLTTSLSSRDWLVGGTFTGAVTGSTKGGTLEVGYQIGCGVAMDKVRLLGLVGVNVGNTAFDFNGLDIFDTVAAPISGQVRVEPRPGTVETVSVYKKEFKGTAPRVTVKDIHIKVDNCVGASSLRSYAVLNSTANGSSDIVAYYGVTKVF